MKSGDAAAADRVEKTNFVSDVHKVGMFWGKGTKKVRVTRRTGNKKIPVGHMGNGEFYLGSIRRSFSVAIIQRCRSRRGSDR